KFWWSTYRVLPKYAHGNYKHSCGDLELSYRYVGQYRYDDIKEDGWYLSFAGRDDPYYEKIVFCPWCGVNLNELNDGWIIVNTKLTQFGFVEYLLRDFHKMNTHGQPMVFSTKDEAEEKLEYIKLNGVCENTQFFK